MNEREDSSSEGELFFSRLERDTHGTRFMACINCLHQIHEAYRRTFKMSDRQPVRFVIVNVRGLLRVLCARILDS